MIILLKVLLFVLVQTHRNKMLKIWNVYRQYDYITQGAIVRSRATWYEKGENIF